MTKFKEMMEVSHLDTAVDDNRVATVLDSYGTYLRDQGRASSLRIFEAACKSAGPTAALKWLPCAGGPAGIASCYVRA